MDKGVEFCALKYNESRYNNVIQNYKANAKQKLSMADIWNYVENCLHILITTFMADAILRAFKALREYLVYSSNYESEDRIWIILKRVYTYNVGTQVTMAVCLALSVVQHIATGKFRLLPPLYFLVFMPLYWLICGVNFSQSTIDYAMWIRDDHGLDSASGMASSYFHGYLNLTMPAYDDNGIRKRIEVYEQQQGVKFAINKLVILVPTTMYIGTTIESRILSQASSLETQIKNRAGISRPYKNSVYRFTEPINGTFYYVALEGATPILTFFETINHQHTNTWQIKEMKRETLMKFYKHLRKLVEGCEETRDAIELILYDEYTDDGKRQDVGEMLLDHFKKSWPQEHKDNSTAKY